MIRTETIKKNQTTLPEIEEYSICKENTSDGIDSRIEIAEGKTRNLKT